MNSKSFVFSLRRLKNRFSHSYLLSHFLDVLQGFIYYLFHKDSATLRFPFLFVNNLMSSPRLATLTRRRHNFYFPTSTQKVLLFLLDTEQVWFKWLITNILIRFFHYYAQHITQRKEFFNGEKILLHEDIQPQYQSNSSFISSRIYRMVSGFSIDPV